MNAPANIRELRISELSIHSGTTAIVRNISLSLRPGQPLTLLGESGSGKSLVAQTVMGTLPPDLVAAGTIRLDDADLIASSPEERRKRWGRAISLLPQEPWLALDPTMRVGPQVAEYTDSSGDKQRCGATLWLGQTSMMWVLITPARSIPFKCRAECASAPRSPSHMPPAAVF